MYALLDRESLPDSGLKQNNCDSGVNESIILNCALDKYKFSFGLTELNWLGK
jgi:hypothetical protein